MGRSRGGLSTKIHLATDQRGRAKKLILSPGHKSDYSAAAELINGLQFDTLIADKGYDADWLIQQATNQCSAKQIVIPARSRKDKLPRRSYNELLYRKRNNVERYFSKLKEWRRVLTRFEKKAANFLAFVKFAAAIINQYNCQQTLVQLLFLTHKIRLIYNMRFQR